MGQRAAQESLTSSRQDTFPRKKLEELIEVYIASVILLYCKNYIRIAQSLTGVLVGLFVLSEIASGSEHKTSGYFSMGEERKPGNTFTPLRARQ